MTTTRITHDKITVHGFTLIELLAVVAIVSILIALALPAVQSSQESARTTQCQSNLRQIGLALGQYADAMRMYPAGRVGSGEPRNVPPNSVGVSGRSVHLALLPYLDAKSIYDNLNFELPLIGTTPNWTAELARPSAYVCPSDTVPLILPGYPNAHRPYPDPPSGYWPFATTQYVFFFGTIPCSRLQWENNVQQVRANVNGSFNDIAPMRPGDILDGLSNTMFAAERALGPIYDRIAQEEGSVGRWLIGDQSYTLTLAAFPPNSAKSFDPNGYWGAVLGASSMHPGGVNVLMGDGSVRFVGDSIDSWANDPVQGTVPCPSAIGPCEAAPGVWQKLCTRAGREL